MDRGDSGQGQCSLQILPGCDTPGAFYSEKLPAAGSLGRMVVLNTNLYYSNNQQTEGLLDPAQQFQWLEAVLTDAAQAGERVRTSAPLPPILCDSLNVFLPAHRCILMPLACTKRGIFHAQPCGLEPQALRQGPRG